MKSNRMVKLRSGTRTRSTAAAALLAVLLLTLALSASAASLTVRVSPDRAHTTPGGSVRFTAVVLDETGARVDARVAWTLIRPGLGTIDGAGTFVAGTSAGRAIVRATAERRGISSSGHAVIDVGGEPPSRLVVAVSPATAAVESNGEQSFTAVVTDPNTGEEVAADIDWIVIPERLGTMTGDGLFVASGDAGTGRIAARASFAGREGVGDAALVVGASAPAGAVVTVVPRALRLEPGESSRFEAVVTDAEGEAVDANVEWLVMPKKLGVIGSDGVFTAGPDAGSGRVVASVGTEDGPSRGFASVEIARPGPSGITVRILPREAAVLPGDDVSFEAEVLGPDGVPLEVPVDWSVTPDWIGAIGTDGIFTASDEIAEPPTNGVWLGTVTASVETESGVAGDAARLIVRDTGPRLRLRIHPARPVLAPGQEVQFEGQVLGPNAPDDWLTEWTVVPADLGTVTPDGLFMANPVFGDPTSGEFGPRDGAVVARVTLPDGSTLTARTLVRIRVPGQPVRIRVSPAIATVAPGATAQFNAAVLGPDGTDLALPVTWHVRPREIGTITPDGLFTAAGHQGNQPSGQGRTGLVVAQVRLPGGNTFRGGAAVIIDPGQ